MAVNRIIRINEGIQRELSQLLRELKDPRIQGMISITRVDTTSDLRTARVWVSVLDKDTEKEVLKGLKSASGHLRRGLGTALQLRYTPELAFLPDRSIETGSHVLELLNHLDIPKEEPEAAPEEPSQTQE